MGVNKKIAILCNYELLPERVGGMDYFFWEFDAKCKQNNVEVNWFFPNRSEHGDYGNLTIFDSNNQNVEFFFLDFCFQNNPSYTHVITHFVELCTPFFYKIKRFSNAQVIAVDHNPRPLNGYSVKKKIEKRLKGILFSRYIDLFVGVSKYTVNALVYDFGNHLQQKIKTIYNGVIIDDIKVRAQRNYTNPTFLVASHLRESKGIQDLIEAVARLPVAIKSKLVIDIYGDGPYKAFLLNKIRDKQLEANFNFKGSVSNLKELYCQYDYMLQPTHMECFSLSILESLAADVPVITTNVGGNQEVITNNKNGFITTAKDISALQHVIKKVYLGDFKITQDTRALVETRFSLDSMVNNYLKLI